MGHSFLYKCKNCGTEGSVSLGVGMRYPSFCVDEKERALRGELGEEAMAAVKEYPGGSFDCTEALYKCECGYWRSECKHAYRIPRGLVPDKDFFMELTSRNSRLVWEKPHTCAKCGKKMKRYRGDMRELKCPECGGEIDICEACLWD